MENTLVSLAGKQMNASLCVTSIARIFWRAVDGDPDAVGAFIDVPNFDKFKIRMTSDHTIDSFTIARFERIVPEIEWAFEVCRKNFDETEMRAIVSAINRACVEEITMRIAEIEHYDPNVIRLSDRGLAALDLFGAKIGEYELSRGDIDRVQFTHIDPRDRALFIKWTTFSSRMIPSTIIVFARTLHDIFAKFDTGRDRVAESYDQMRAYAQFLGHVANIYNLDNFYFIWYNCSRKVTPILRDIVECMLDHFIVDYPQEVEKISSNCQVLRAHYFAWYDQ